jgi:UDP-2-acetamido-2,6-beta-L-arabino-hexul-4-ose reductase
MNILITGSDGFIGKNLFYKLSEYNKFNILTINKKTSRKRMESNLLNADIIFHLAGINKETLPQYNYENNFNFTNDICCFLKKNKKNTKIIYASTTQVKLNNVYGKSKLKAEKILLNYKKKTNADLIIYRLPNVFGKWSKPSYNSVVSTFCYNISRKKNIIVTEPNKKIKLLYIDDLLDSFLSNIKNKKKDIFIKIKNTYTLSLLELSKLIKSFYLNEKNYLLTNISNPFIKKIYTVITNQCCCWTHIS